jgi:hypothetical protein
MARWVVIADAGFNGVQSDDATSRPTGGIAAIATAAIAEEDGPLARGGFDTAAATADADSAAAGWERLWISAPPVGVGAGCIAPPPWGGACRGSGDDAACARWGGGSAAEPCPPARPAAAATDVDEAAAAAAAAVPRAAVGVVEDKVGGKAMPLLAAAAAGRIIAAAAGSSGMAAPPEGRDVVAVAVGVARKGGAWMWWFLAFTAAAGVSES